LIEFNLQDWIPKPVSKEKSDKDVSKLSREEGKTEVRNSE